MKAAESKRPQEPVGIVINHTIEPPQSTVFLAYEWSPAPSRGEDEPKAA